MNTAALGEIVKARRGELRVDQRALASLAGVSVHTLARIMRVRVRPARKDGAQ